MEMLTEIFRQVVQLGIAALPVIGVVLAVRALLRRAPRRAACVLWLVVALRLLLPAGLLRQAPYSLYNLEPVRTVTEFAETVTTQSAPSAGAMAAPILDTVGQTASTVAQTVTAANGAGLMPLLAGLWLLGMAALLGYAALADVRLRRRLATAVRRDTNVYECDELPTPMVLGLLRPRIYIPFRMDDSQRTYVLCHERCHIRRLDPWWKLLAYVLCAVYWWNPAVWLCWVLFCRDLESSCDEAVLAELGSSAKEGYGLSLVDFAAGRRFPAPSPLAFGEGDAKHRVKNVLRWREATPRIVFLSFCLLLAVLLACTTNGQRRSWVKLEPSPAGLGVAFTCRLEEPVRSWAVYQDIYEDGVLRSSEPILLTGFEGDEFPLPRKLTAYLHYQVENAAEGDGFAGTLRCSFAEVPAGSERAEAASAWNVPLSEASYLGSGSMIGDDGVTGKKKPLGGDGGVVLLTVVMSNQDNGAITFEHEEKGVIGANDAVVQYRLVTSQTTAEHFSATAAVQSYAETLYALRSPYVGNAPAAGALLSALDVGALGDYTLELFTSAEPYILQVNFTEEPEDIDPTSPTIDLAMMDHAAVLLSLIDNLSEVRWTYPSREDGQTFLVTMYFDIATANAMAAFRDDPALAAYGEIKACGQSPEGIAALLAALDGPVSPDAQDEPGLLVSNGAGDTVAANWYPDGDFDFNYDALPVLTLPGGGALTLETLGWEAETLTVGEDYYSGVADHATEVLRNSYLLSGDRVLPVNHLHPQREEQAVYYVAHGEGKFVFRVILPPEE